MKPAGTATADTANMTMESLALPQELYWDGKVEPTSPAHNEPFTSHDHPGFWLHDGDFSSISIKDDAFEIKTTIEFPHDLLVGDDVPEFYGMDGWSDDKLGLLGVDGAISQPNAITKISNVFEISSLESENFDTAVLTSLTPPQSPPQTIIPISLQNILPTEAVINFNDVLQSALTPQPSAVATPLSSAPVSPAAPATTTQTVANSTFASYCGTVAAVRNVAQTELATHDDDDARNSQIVDEFLRSCVQELPNLNEDSESLSSYSLPSSGDSIITDEEWMPESSSSLSSSASSSPSHSGGDDNMQVTPTGAATKKRTRPYGRGIEDRKIRKKEQNKNAATRYRQKKKLEMEIVLGEEQQLLKRNEELKRILGERQREAKYLRTLIKEFYKNRK